MFYGDDCADLLTNNSQSYILEHAIIVLDNSCSMLEQTGSSKSCRVQGQFFQFYVLFGCLLNDTQLDSLHSSFLFRLTQSFLSRLIEQLDLMISRQTDTCFISRRWEQFTRNSVHLLLSAVAACISTDQIDRRK